MNNPQEALMPMSSSSLSNNNDPNNASVGNGTTARNGIHSKHKDKSNVHVGSSSTSKNTTKKKSTKKSKEHRKKKQQQRSQRRIARIVSIEEEVEDNEADNHNGSRGKTTTAGKADTISTSPSTTTTKMKTKKSMKRRRRLPPGQYETTLRRRAIRKSTSLRRRSKSPTKSLAAFTNNNDNTHQQQQLEDQHDQAAKAVEDQEEEEIYGDVSLGMKLTILGGKVIVQLLNPLSDGRASPAQLTGLISRGDVLLAVDNAPLLNLPLDQLMERLKPLSSPTVAAPTTSDGGSSPEDGGSYCRTLTLRFGIGEGLSLLSKSEQNSKSKQDPLLASWNVPFVDQWSGMPMVFPQSSSSVNGSSKTTPKGQALQQESKESSTKDETAIVPTTPRASKQQFLHLASDESLTENQYISITIANYKQWDRERYMSAYFAWNEKYSELLRSPPIVQLIVNMQKEKEEEEKMTHNDEELTRTEMLQQGTRVMAGAKVLSYMMESMDKGKDTRSFRKWNSTLSLRSKTSRMSRKKHRAGRFLLDSSSNHSMRILEGSDEDEEDDDVDTSLSMSNHGTDAASAGGSTTGSESLDLDPDEHLLGLAAHDEIWRKQVVHTLEESVLDMKKHQREEKEEKAAKDGKSASNSSLETKKINDKKVAPHQKSLDSALSMQLGSFLFGEQVSQLVKKRQRTFALPPEEVTAVLFDLTKIIASATPGEITLQGATGTEPSVVLTFSKQSKSSSTTMTDDNAALAHRFVVEEALPAWLKAFRPLPWDQRRMLWQQSAHGKGNDRGLGDSFTIGMGTTANSEDDGLTLDSDSTGFHAGAKTSKTLQEQIEDMELDAETKMETCDLVTFYFMQHLLRKLEVPKKLKGPENEDEDYESMEKAAVDFVERYGAYLELNRCLVKAGEVESDNVVRVLLSMAKKDKIHQAAMKEISKANVLVLYESTMLSALLKRLRGIRKETRQEYRSALITLCVSAFPDVRPWQVRKACLTECTDEEDAPQENDEKESFNYDELYYEYLSQLLHPTEGHEMARHDQKQVEEWVNMSALSVADPASSKQRRENFYKVASTASSDHRMYYRDLVLLMDLSMDIEEYNLALDLASEIVHDTQYSLDKEIVSNALEHVRKIAKLSLKPESADPESIDVPTMQRILRLFQVMMNKPEISRGLSIDVSDELYHLLLSQRTSSDDTLSADSPSKKELAFIDLLVRKAVPGDVLQMLLQWTSTHPSPCCSMPIIHQTLLRGAQVGVHTELSGSLLRIRQARLRSGTRSWAGATVFLDEHEKSAISKDGAIWKRMHKGTAVVDK